MTSRANVSSEWTGDRNGYAAMVMPRPQVSSGVSWTNTDHVMQLFDPYSSTRRWLKLGLTIGGIVAGPVFGILLTLVEKIITNAPPATFANYAWNAAVFGVLAGVVSLRLHRRYSDTRAIPSLCRRTNAEIDERSLEWRGLRPRMKGTDCLIALVLLCACVGDDLESSRLVLERHPCLGTCPSYRLAIGPDGRVDYEGLGYFNTLEPAPRRSAFRRDSIRLAPEDAARLLAAFDWTFSTWWPNQYVPWRRFTCPVSATDAPTLTIVREQRSRRDTLQVYYACPYVPARIHRLGIYIDSVVGVNRWLGPTPPR